MSLDPLSLIYANLWEGVESHPEIDSWVKVANRVKFDAENLSEAKARKTVQAADLPELMLVYETMSGALRSSSSSTTFDIRWAWVITAGDMRLDKAILPISWIILEAMVRWHATLTNIEWGGARIIKKIDFVGSRTGESEVLRMSNVRGWSTVHTLQTQIVLPTAVMVNRATPESEDG